MKSDRQRDMFKKKSHRFGGGLRTRRADREQRPISVKQSMHLMLKSTLAKGEWSFLRPKNKQIVARAVREASKKYGVQIFSFANVGNHLHLHLQFRSRRSYLDFVRSVTGTIALKVTRSSKLNPLRVRPHNVYARGQKLMAQAAKLTAQTTQLTAQTQDKKAAVKLCFWTQSPYTRFVFGAQDFLKITDYLTVNQIEGFGYRRGLAEYLVKNGVYIESS